MGAWILQPTFVPRGSIMCTLNIALHFGKWVRQVIKIPILFKCLILPLSTQEKFTHVEWLKSIGCHIFCQPTLLEFLLPLSIPNMTLAASLYQCISSTGKEFCSYIQYKASRVIITSR